VFYFFPFYHTGGAEKVHAQIAAATGGNDCIIYFTKRSVDSRFMDDFKSSGCDVRDISSYADNKLLYFLNLVCRGIITGYINSQRTSPVVFNGQCNFAYKISPWINKSVPQIELIHSLNSFSYIRIPFLSFISTTVMISKKRIEDHKKLYNRCRIPLSFLEKIKYIPNAIRLPQSIVLKNNNDFIVLYVGRGTVEKRVRLVAETAKALKNEKMNFEIMGDVTDSLNKDHYPFIQFYGNIHNENTVSEIFGKAHVLMLTSSTEGFPMVIMEAMAHGCAILTTAVGDIPYHVKSNENGFLFTEIEDEKSIISEAIEKIIWLRSNRDELKRIADNNIQYANHNFGIERFNKDYRDLFLSVKKKIETT
jgi:glycosyltransferase involved in cell wall biosynthesis